MRPVSKVRDNRQTYVGTEFDIGLWVTFHSALSFRILQICLHGTTFRLPMLPANQFVIEIKVDERAACQLSELIIIHNLLNVRVSNWNYHRSIFLN